MSYADYDANSLNLALDLASLGDGTLGADDFLRAQSLMFTDHGLSTEALAQLGGLGERIADVLARESGDDFLDALGALLEAQDCRPYLTRHDGRPHLHYARDDAPPDQWIATMAVSGLVRYVVAVGRDRLRRCAADGCGRWFADTSRNRSRRYCSGACASRTTVAAYRARQVRGADSIGGADLPQIARSPPCPASSFGSPSPAASM